MLQLSHKKSVQSLISLLLPLILWAGVVLALPVSLMSNILTLCVFFIILAWYKFDYLNPVVAYSLPWVLILAFSSLDLSIYARELSLKTYLLIKLSLLIWLTGGIILKWRDPKPKPHHFRERLRRDGFKIYLLILGFYLFVSLVSIGVAGYIPFLEGIRTGNTRYLEFGIPGVHGIYIAFANAFGLLSFYLYLLKKKQIYLLVFLLTLSLFIMFVSRQNIIASLIGVVVIYSFHIKKLKTLQIGTVFIAMVIAFSILGQFRTGDIRNIAGIEEQYNWLPNSIVWVYSYGYFNILNLDNLISNSPPLQDGSAFASLVPSPLRPEYNHGYFREVPNFTVSSYLYPLYQDIGLGGAIAFTLLAFSIAMHLFYKAQSRSSFFNIASYAIIYFCGLFSFFVNYWFYLPIIFQIVFFALLSRLVLKQERVPTPTKIV